MESNKLGGGNSNIFYFHPENWGNDPISRIFFRWVQTANQFWVHWSNVVSFTHIGNEETSYATFKTGIIDSEDGMGARREVIENAPRTTSKDHKEETQKNTTAAIMTKNHHHHHHHHHHHQQQQQQQQHQQQQQQQQTATNRNKDQKNTRPTMAAVLNHVGTFYRPITQASTSIERWAFWVMGSLVHIGTTMGTTMAWWFWWLRFWRFRFVQFLHFFGLICENEAIHENC